MRLQRKEKIHSVDKVISFLTTEGARFTTLEGRRQERLHSNSRPSTPTRECSADNRRLKSKTRKGYNTEIHPLCTLEEGYLILLVLSPRSPPPASVSSFSSSSLLVFLLFSPRSPSPFSCEERNRKGRENRHEKRNGWEGKRKGREGRESNGRPYNT